MKRLTSIFFFAIVFCLFAVTAFAQTMQYFNENGGSATAGNYFYKRVYKYDKPVAFGIFSTNQITGADRVSINQSGYHLCSFTDYYRTGETAAVGNIVAADIGCTQRGGFIGQVVYYYKNGNIKRHEPWNSGKLHGTVISYNENGSEMKREEYVEGNKIETEKFVVSADNPFIGTWKFIEYSSLGYELAGVKVDPVVKREITFALNQNGTLNWSRSENFMIYSGALYWKYTPSNCTTGTFENYNGNDLAERANIKWVNNNKIEYTVTFPQNSNGLGNKLVFERVGGASQRNLCNSNFNQLNKPESNTTGTGNVQEGFNNLNFGTNTSPEGAAKAAIAERNGKASVGTSEIFNPENFGKAIDPKVAAKAAIDARNENAAFLLGVWKFTDEITKASMKLIFSKDFAADMIVTMNGSTEAGSFNWNYEKKDNSSGVLTFFGDKGQTADIRWLNNNQFVYTITASKLQPKTVGLNLVFTRQ